MLREIGSNFWINPKDTVGGICLHSPSMFGCEGNDYVWLSTGRSAIRLILQTIEERSPNAPRIALIPSFTCYTVIEPFIDSGYKIIPLPIDNSLNSSPEEILTLQKETNASVVLIHNYFGFITTPDLKSISAALNSQGAVFIEDRTQCLYSGYPSSMADYYVGSIRKWCGVPDGGFAVCRDGSFGCKPTKPDFEMIKLKRKASELKYQFIYYNLGDKSSYKRMYRDAETLLDNQNELYSIGGLSAIIQSGLNIQELKEKRRENYLCILAALRNSLKIKPIFNSLPNEVTPLYFPVLVENQIEVQSLLANNDVYAPIVWPKADCCPSVSREAEYIYNHILCIPIDQRYGIDDMERIISIIYNER